MHKTYNTPLFQKLGIREHSTLITVNAPKGYEEIVGRLPMGASVATNLKGNSDLIQLFAKSREELVKN